MYVHRIEIAPGEFTEFQTYMSDDQAAGREFVGWKDVISEEMLEHGESFDDIVSTTLTDEDLGRRFLMGHRADDRLEFTVWTEKRVYFPLNYDGDVGCGSVSRIPDGKPTEQM